MQNSIFFRKSYKNYPLDCNCKYYKELLTLQSSDDESLSSLPFEFCRESSLHGLRFVGNTRRHTFERVFWFLAFIVSVCLAVYSISMIWDKYNQTPIITVFRPAELTIDRIAFPAVTICNSNNVRKEKVELLTKLLLQNKSDAISNHELYILDHVCESSETFSERFNFSLEEGSLTQSVRNKLLEASKADMSHPDVKDREFISVLRNVAQRCSQMILLCIWNDEITNCVDLFEGIETDYGYCCVFNMAPADVIRSFRVNSKLNKEATRDWRNLDLDADKMVLTKTQADKPNTNTTQNPKTGPKYPRRQFRPGKSSGLSILLNPELDSYFCTNTDSAGFMALAHLPLTFPTISDKAAAIIPNAEVFMKIKPEITMADTDIMQFPLDKRNCYFGTEHPLVHYKYYTSANCEDECIASLTYQECQCVRYYMPRNSTQKLCGPNQFNCTELVRKRILQEGLRLNCQDCLPTCTEIEYEMSISYIPLRQDVSLWRYPNGTDAPWAHKNVSILHVHFDVDSTYPKLRTELYGFLDLLSSTGGLLGLCLGFSVLSLLEIIYYVTIRVCCASKKGKKLGKKFDEATDSAWQKAKTVLAEQNFAKRFQKSNSPVFNIPLERSSPFSNFYEGRISRRKRSGRKPNIVSNDLGNIRNNPTQQQDRRNITEAYGDKDTSDKSLFIRW